LGSCRTGTSFSAFVPFSFFFFFFRLLFSHFSENGPVLTQQLSSKSPPSLRPGRGLLPVAEPVQSFPSFTFPGGTSVQDQPYPPSTFVSPTSPFHGKPPLPGNPLYRRCSTSHSPFCIFSVQLAPPGRSDCFASKNLPAERFPLQWLFFFLLPHFPRLSFLPVVPPSAMFFHFLLAQKSPLLLNCLQVSQKPCPAFALPGRTSGMQIVLPTFFSRSHLTPFFLYDDEPTPPPNFRFLLT